jgi:hypothetical protein
VGAWPDEDATSILGVCADAMAPGARLLIVEQLLPSGDALDLIAGLMDLNMLVLFGGQERDADEYRALLEKSGITAVTIRPTSGRWTVIESIRQETPASVGPRSGVRRHTADG